MRLDNQYIFHTWQVLNLSSLRGNWGLIYSIFKGHVKSHWHFAMKLTVLYLWEHCNLYLITLVKHLLEDLSVTLLCITNWLLLLLPEVCKTVPLDLGNSWLIQWHKAVWGSCKIVTHIFQQFSLHMTTAVATLQIGERNKLNIKNMCYHWPVTMSLSFPSFLCFSVLSTIIDFFPKTDYAGHISCILEAIEIMEFWLLTLLRGNPRSSKRQKALVSNPLHCPHPSILGEASLFWGALQKLFE